MLPFKKHFDANLKIVVSGWKIKQSKETLPNKMLRFELLSHSALHGPSHQSFYGTNPVVLLCCLHIDTSTDSDTKTLVALKTRLDISASMTRKHETAWSLGQNMTSVL